MFPLFTSAALVSGGHRVAGGFVALWYRCLSWRLSLAEHSECFMRGLKRVQCSHSTSSLTPLPVVGLQSRAVAATCNGVFPFRYASFETFALDVRLVFDNCETFNEDDSDIGRAGHRMRKYFEKKWTDTFKVSWSCNLLFLLFLFNKDKQDQQCELTAFTQLCKAHAY